jgi:hypothetical protein
LDTLASDDVISRKAFGKILKGSEEPLAAMRALIPGEAVKVGYDPQRGWILAM